MKQLLALLAFALIAGCGFKPVYATGGGAVSYTHLTLPTIYSV